MKTVLYISFASHNFDGATLSLIDLIDSLKHEITPIVLLPEEGCVSTRLRELGIECIACKFEQDLCTEPHTLKQYVGYFGRLLPYSIRYHSANRSCVRTVSKMLYGRKIDIVHSNSAVLTIGYDLANSLGAKFVWHLREFLNLDFGLKPLTGWRSHRNKLLKTDAVIGITNSVLKHYLPNPNTHSCAIFDAVRKKNEASFNTIKEKYVLFCAGIVLPVKGCDSAVNAFALSGLWKEGYRLRVIGRVDGIYGARLMEHVHKSGIEDYIDFIPFTKDVKTHMERAKAFLMCSAHEGMGRVTVEAMFYGTPVVARNSGGTVDFIKDNQTGFLFNTDEECADRLRFVVQNDCAKIIEQARDFAINNFSIEDYGGKILKIYNSITNN